MKSNIRNIKIVFSSLASILIFCQTANAEPKGLNVGAPVRIPKGQESQYLQYQLQNNGNGLRQMRVMPQCVVGEGLRCGKTGTVLEEIIKSNGGPTYQQMLMRAAGGEDNFKKFATYYGNNPNLFEQPIVYSSLWRNGSDRFLDSFTYTLGQPLSRNPVEGLREVTEKFSRAPFKGQDPYRAFADLKVSYGVELIQEVAKISNFKEQINQLDLPPDALRFYQNNVARAISAINGGYDEELTRSIFTILSHSYSPSNSDNYGREYVEEMPSGVVNSGLELPADEIALVTDEALAKEMIVSVEELGGNELLPTSDGGANLLPLAAIPLIMLVLALLGSDSSSNDSAQVIGTNVPITPPVPDYVCPDLNLGGGGSGNSGQVGEVQCDIPITPTPEVKKVVEPSALKAIILLTLILCLVNYKKRRRQQLT